jgi:hypothetical protein
LSTGKPKPKFDKVKYPEIAAVKKWTYWPRNDTKQDVEETSDFAAPTAERPPKLVSWLVKVQQVCGFTMHPNVDYEDWAVGAESIDLEERMHPSLDPQTDRNAVRQVNQWVTYMQHALAMHNEWVIWIAQEHDLAATIRTISSHG